MKTRFSKLLSVLLCLSMLLSAFGFTVIAEETEVQTEYYAKAGGTGDGRSAESPAGSLATVINAINADGHAAGDNVTVYIMRGNNEVFVYTEDMIATMKDMYLVYSSTAHNATITYTSYDDQNSSIVFALGSGYICKKGYTGSHMVLAGPTVYKNINLLDIRADGTANDIVLVGNTLELKNVSIYKALYSPIKAGGTLPNGETATADTPAMNLKGYGPTTSSKWNGHVRMGTNKTTAHGKSPVVIVDNPAQLQDISLGNYQEKTASMYTAGDVTAYVGAGTLNNVFFDTAYSAADVTKFYNVFQKNVNLSLDGTTVNEFKHQKSGSKGVVIQGALQVLYHNGSTVKKDNATRFSDTARKNALTNEFHVVVPAGVKLDFTSAAGVYTVDSDKLVYAVSDDGKFIYHSANGLIKIRKPGRYTLATAESVDAIKAAVALPVIDEKYQLNGWVSAFEGSGLIYADYVLKTEAEEGVYYVKHGATGDGLTAATAGNIKSVVAAINEKYGAGDTVTVKVVGTESDKFESVSTDYLSKLSHTALIDITEHTAMIVLTSADPDERVRVVWKNEYSTANDKGARIDLTGPLTIKDIDVVDTRYNYYWDFYVEGKHFVIGEGSNWYRPLVTNGMYKLEGRAYEGTIQAGSRNGTSFNNPILIELADNSFNNFAQISFAGYHEKTKATYGDDVTIKLGKGTAKKVVVSTIRDTYAIFKKNVNLVLDGTTVTAFANREATVEKAAVVKGAIQIIKNNGAKVTANTVLAFTDDAKTTPSPVWDITVASGSKLDVTDKAGVYTVSGNPVYYADAASGKVYYYTDKADLTAFGAGTYSLGSASNVQSIPLPSFITVPAGKRFAGWLVDKATGVLTAEFVENANKYYVKYGGTGTGRSANLPMGNIADVISLINADGLKEGDNATVYLVPTGNEPTKEQLNLKSGDAPVKLDKPNGFISFQAPNVAHTATITYTTYNYDAAKDNKMILANGDKVSSSNYRDGSGHMYISGPTVFKDIYILDLRMDNASWDFYGQSHDLRIENVDWRKTSGSGNAGGRGFTFNIWNNHFYLGNHSSNTYSPATDANFEVYIDNADFIGDLSLSSRPNKDGTVKKGDSVYRIGNDKAKGVITDLFLGSSSTSLTSVAKQDGTVSAIFNNTTIRTLKHSENKTTKDDVTTVTPLIPVITNVQILLNNGSVIEKNTTKLEGNLFILKAEKGVELDITKTVGTFAVDVADGMFAMATDGKNTYYSVAANGAHTITVPAGTYTVSAVAPVTEENGTITVGVPGTIDFAEFETAKENKIFLGWKDKDGNWIDLSESTEKAVLAGDTYTAEYQEFTTDSEEADMYVLGAQIRITPAQEEESAKADLRYVTQIKKEFLSSEIIGIEDFTGGENVKYGHIVLPAEEAYRANGELLELGKATSKGAVPSQVPAAKLYKNEDDFVTFTVCLTGITPAKYTRCFAVRPYILYTDKNGVENVIYGEQYETASLVRIAEMGKVDALEKGEEIPEVIESILSAVAK